MTNQVLHLQYLQGILNADNVNNILFKYSKTFIRYNFNTVQQ